MGVAHHRECRLRIVDESTNGVSLHLVAGRHCELCVYHSRCFVFALSKGEGLNMLPNRVGGRVAPPASHTTVHAGPRTAVPGSPCGRSSHSFSATLIAAQMLSRSASSLRDKTNDGRVLPAKFSPSRVVSPSGFSRLVALGTTASADSCSRTAAIPGHRPHRCRWARATGLPE
jgi:hypothetical protein